MASFSLPDRLRTGCAVLAFPGAPLDRQGPAAGADNAGLHLFRQAHGAAMAPGAGNAIQSVPRAGPAAFSSGLRQDLPGGGTLPVKRRAGKGKNRAAGPEPVW